MITWWVALAFPLAGLLGLCVLLRPHASTGAVAPASSAELTGLRATQALRPEGRIDPPAM